MAEIKVSLSPKDIEAIATRTASLLKSDTAPEVFTATQVAKIAKVHINTIRQHIRDGLLIASKNGKSYLVSKENLNKYLNNE